MKNTIQKVLTRRNYVEILEVKNPTSPVNQRFYYSKHPTIRGEFIKPLFDTFLSKADYVLDKVQFIEPMTAKEVANPEWLYNSPDYIAEEKLDGVREILHVHKGCVRLFSRRVSTKTGWLNENTDSMPHIRDMNISDEWEGTILDGELTIPQYGFKEVSGTLNCLWHEAVNRQLKLGFIVFNAFDILYYKGEDVREKPLYERKELLSSLINAWANPYVQEVLSIKDTICRRFTQDQIDRILQFKEREQEKYPELFAAFLQAHANATNAVTLNKQAYHELIVYDGGEGTIHKRTDGVYECGKKSNFFLKVKKLLSRDVIIMGFTLPTKEYGGKAPETWKYWENTETQKIVIIDWEKGLSVNLKRYRKAIESGTLIPVSKYYAEQWVGNVVYGVVITDTEIDNLPKDKKFNIVSMLLENGIRKKVIEVGDCSGFDEEQRQIFSSQYITEDGDYVFCKTPNDYDRCEKEKLQGVVWTGRTIEIFGNEIFKDTGKLRNPRFHTLRHDKSPLECTWSVHIAKGE